MLSPVKINNSRVERTIIGEGAVIVDSDICDAVIGVRSFIGAGTRMRRAVLLGSDYYPWQDASERSPVQGPDRPGIGEGTVIEGAIVDRNASIGKGCVITNAQGIEEERFVIIPNGIPPRQVTEIPRAEACRRLDVDPARKLILAVGRLWPQKRYRDLIWAADLIATLRGEYSHKSRIFHDPVNSPGGSQDGYSLVNARLSVEAMDESWRLSLFGNNLADEIYMSNAYGEAPSFGYTETYWAPPREWGVSLDIRF